MFTIHLRKTIHAPQDTVWQVITRTADYADWNPFVLACESTFAVGAPIVMRVRLTPSMTIQQKETVRANIPGERLEYGVQLPFGLLASSRQHILTTSSPGSCDYQSLFELKGLLAPLVKWLLGAQLQRGFRDMTDGVAQRAEHLAGKGQRRDQ